jgi:hypothetical protein
LINEVLEKPQDRAYTTNGDETLLAEFRMNFAKNCGVSVVGEFDPNDQFRYEYCYPYFLSDRISTQANVTIEPRIREEAYSGVVDDLKLGVTLIFHLQNLVEYVRSFTTATRCAGKRHGAVSLAGLCSRRHDRPAYPQDGARHSAERAVKTT